jgi:hypothetical protein
MVGHGFACRIFQIILRAAKHGGPVAYALGSDVFHQILRANCIQFFQVLMTPPLDHFPDRHDYERGCMADGSHLRFASRALYPSWGSPLPGKSNVLKKARK